MYSPTLPLLCIIGKYIYHTALPTGFQLGFSNGGHWQEMGEQVEEARLIFPFPSTVGNISTRGYFSSMVLFFVRLAMVLDSSSWPMLLDSNNTTFSLCPTSHKSGSGFQLLLISCSSPFWFSVLPSPMWPIPWIKFLLLYISTVFYVFLMTQKIAQRVDSA